MDKELTEQEREMYLDMIARMLEGHKQDSNYTPTYTTPEWVFQYKDGIVNNVSKHHEERLDEVLKQFEYFCKGCGFEFAGFAVVDEDGIPIHGLSPLARLEAGKDDEDTSG